MTLSSQRGLLSAILLLALTLGSSAQAYQLKKDSTGAVVRWANAVEFVVDKDIASKLGQADAKTVIEDAFRHFKTAAGVPVSVRAGTVGTLGYNFEDTDENRNEIFAPAEWDYEPNMIAVTLVTLNTKTHQIIDADIAFNVVHRDFVIVDPDGDTVNGDDIQNAFTHELGHAVGLAHNPELLEAVMYPGARKGEINKRTLTSDDLAGLSELYPTAVGSISSELSPENEGIVGCTAVRGDLALMALVTFLPLLLRRRKTT